MQPGPSFTPGTPNMNPNLSAGASTFTPARRPTSAIKFARPDGTPVNLKEAAAAAKGPTPEVEAVVAQEPPKKKMPSLPVVVRLESEEQKKDRLVEEGRLERIRKEEAREAEERKERQARKEKEAKVSWCMT
jgi:translation initiation factor 4G